MGHMTDGDICSLIHYNDLPDGVSYYKVKTTIYTDSDLKNLKKQENQTEAKEDKKKGKKSILDTIFKFKGNKNQETEVKTPVTVMEIDEFYKTEIGQKVFANLNSKQWDVTADSITRNGYAVKRGDRYFLVSEISTKVYPYFGLDIEKSYFIYPVGNDGTISNNDRIHPVIDIYFDYEEKNGDIIFTPRPQGHVATSIYTGYGIVETNNDIFDKFIAPDPHWFECMTHTGSRQEVLNGTAGASIFEQTENKIKYHLEEQKEEKRNDDRKRRIAEEINAHVQGY